MNEMSIVESNDKHRESFLRMEWESVKARKSCTLEGAVDAVARGYTLLSNPWLQLPIDSYLPDAACPATLATIPEDDGRIMSLRHTTPNPISTKFHNNLLNRLSLNCQQLVCVHKIVI